MTFPVAVDRADVFGNVFKLDAIPVSFLIDEVGIVRVRGGGPDKPFLSQVESLLKEPMTQLRGSAPSLPETSRLSDLQAAVDADLTDWISRLALARVLHASGRLSDAAAHIEQVAKVRPEDPEVMMSWGMILLGQGEKTAAVSKLKTARDLDPKNWRIRKQIWAIENPDKFYKGRSPDYGWQKEELKREKGK